MLQYTFIHAPGIGRTTEQKLWDAGVRSWTDFLARDPMLLPSRCGKGLRVYIEQSRHALQERDAGFFRRLAKLGETWRTYEEFADRCVFLDIETTGYLGQGCITVVGMDYGKGYRQFILGKNLSQVPRELARHSIIITFNGSTFDLPFIRSTWPKCRIPEIHIDLLYPLRRLGYTGGLGAVEKRFGIRRPKNIADMNGFDAINLWFKYKNFGDREALARLLEYNAADVENLGKIMHRAFAELRAVRAPFLTRTLVAKATQY